MRRALAPVRWWIRCYTSGLDPRVRWERRAEVESDLWEQWRWAEAHGSARIRIVGSIWMRCLLGVGDDLGWRVGQSAPSRGVGSHPSPGGAARVGVSTARTVALFLGVAVVLLLVLSVVVINTRMYDEGSQPVGAVAAVLLGMVSVATVLGVIVAARGYRLMGDRPAEGAALSVGGVLVAGMMWYWLTVPVVVASALAIHALARAVRMSRSEGQDS